MKVGRVEAKSGSTDRVLTNVDMTSPVRRWNRFKINVRVKIRRWEEPDGAVVVARSHVLSEGGMSVYAPQSLEIGTRVSVEFSLPGAAKEMRLQAVVRNRIGFRWGMEFVKVAADDRKSIQRCFQPE